MQLSNLTQQLMQPRPRPDTVATDILSDKRRWMSFLTWAFVLAEMAGRDGLLPTAAHAEEADSRQPDHHASDIGPIANNLPNVDVSTSTESPDPIAYQHAAQMPAYTVDTLPSELASAKTIPVADLGHDAPMTGYGGGGGGYAGDAGAASHGDSIEDVHAGGLDSPIVVALGHDGSLIDVGLNLNLGDTVHDVLGLVSGTLGHLPIVGGVLGGVVGTVDNIVSSAVDPLVSLVGGDGQHHGGLLGLPGQLLFGDSSHETGSSELMSPGGNYNSYGIAVSTGAYEAGSATDTATHSDTHDAATFDLHLGHDLPDQHVASDALHLDQALLKTATDILA